MTVDPKKYVEFDIGSRLALGLNRVIELFEIEIVAAR